jgi:tRNA threonylcarbamoyladenosine biosynthesis protein TsaB
MRALALDTTSPPGSLALWDRGDVISLRPVQDDRPFGECLPGAVLEALAGAQWSVRQLDLFVVCRGPGSLTGLRVGIATAQGLAFASGRPLVGVSALEALAALLPPGGGAPDLVAAWMDARRGEVFAQLFGRGGAAGERPSVDGPRVGPPAEIARRWLALLGEASFCVAGSAARATAAVWSEVVARPPARLLEPPHLAGTVAALGVRAAGRGLAGPPHAVAPLYVRRPDAEVARDRQRRPQGVR